MFKMLLDKKKRNDLKDKVEVAFAVLTIVSFVSARVKMHKENESEENKAE